MKLNYTEEEELKIINLLRFRNKDPRQIKYSTMSLKKIAQFIGKSTPYVHTVCQKIISNSKKPLPEANNISKMPNIFKQYMINKKEHFTAE